jgi:hypothetical protein
MRVVLRWTAIGAGLLLVLTAGLCLASYRKFSANITTDTAAEEVLAAYAARRPPSLVPQARNILVLGADGLGADGLGADGPGADGPGVAGPVAVLPRTGGAAGGSAGAGEDAAVLLHLSADRTRAAAVGVPRGRRVGVPGCRRPGGGTVRAVYEPFEAAFRSGGAACSIRAFEQLSGVRVDHHLVVDVARFGRIADAVGGAGAAGGDARGDLLRALAGAARGGRASLAHPARLFGLLDTATSAVTADPGLSSLPALYGLAGALRNLAPGAVTLVTLPAVPSGGPVQGPARGNVLRRPAADRLFAALRADRPLAPEAGQ